MARKTVTLTLDDDTSGRLAALAAASPYAPTRAAVALAALRRGLAELEGQPSADAPWDGNGPPTPAQVALYARTVTGPSHPGYDPELEARAIDAGLVIEGRE